MKTNEEIDDMIKDYISENSMDTKSTMDTSSVITTGTSSADTSYSTNDSIYITDDTIDFSGLLTGTTTVSIADNASGNYTYESAEDKTSKRLDRIEKRLSILEPNEELLDKYELLQGLYEQYKAAEAMLHDGDDNEEEELPF
jgi:hypothetical protein